ncbi:hypothetical protein CFIO01_12232 [Colletotrichum fioriniae PJ7]|uniref:Uncharacterized protein n=1 Tax=Colletotrichum fioriniae PJ7 TaxID=1445577 RepID=A0A010SCQ7_9PEZI|nr:hypothetical protein CFIO01_12232 [Colletotrichum fioriniae PJ7]
MANSSPRRRIVISNFGLDSDNGNGKTEPGVEVVTDDLVTEDMFDGLLQRTKIGTISAVPASNEGLQHRTPSVDYVAVNQGTPVLITPKTAFSANDGKADYEETVESLLRPGDVAVQRGAMHAWANRTDEWVRMIGMVIDAKPSEATVDGKRLELGERWLHLFVHTIFYGDIE